MNNGIVWCLTTRSKRNNYNEALAEKIELVERAELERAMREGYLATRTERAELNRDWAVVDAQDWPA